MTDLWQDVRFGARMILKRPLTSGLAIVAFALGIGLTTTMFSIVQGAFLRGLPFPEGKRIVSVARLTAGDQGRNALRGHDYVDMRASRTGIEDLAGVQQAALNVSGGLAPERYRGAAITPNTLRVLRVAPALGRDFNDADGEPGAAPVMIIGYRVWESQFSRDAGVIGRSVRVNGTPTTIVGVMPEKFGFPNREELWTPLSLVLPSKRGEGRTLRAFGRLRPGASIASANADLVAVARRLEEQHPENKNVMVDVQPYTTGMVGQDIVRTFYAMLGAVFGVMLIACANVMSLQLARAAERAREVAVRSALGATRIRVVRQMLIEGALLSVIGAAVGIGLSLVAIDLFVRGITGTGEPFWISIRIDGTVLAFVVGLVCVAAVASSLVPALRATRMDLNAVLKDEGRANTGVQMGRFSRWLVVGEVLLSCCLLVVSGLMIRSVVTIGNITYPFATVDVFIANLSADDKKYPTETDALRVIERLTERWSVVPGVRRVAISTSSPGTGGSAPLTQEGHTYPATKDHAEVRRSVVSPAFFDVLRVSARAGRLIERADVSGAPLVAVVDDSFVRKFYPKGDALGRRIKLTTGAGEWVTIVGVVPMLTVARTNEDIGEGVYLPFAQVPSRNAVILASTTGSPLAITSAIRTAAKEIDEDLTIGGSNSLASSIWQRTWPYRVFGSLFMSFGFAALLLASAGLYGVMAFSVRRRTQEIGVRMALGADRSRVVRMILWQGMWRVALGIALGLVPAYFLGGAMRELLYRTTPGDPLVFGLTVGTLLAAGLVASLVPALRAASVDPLTALRND